MKHAMPGDICVVMGVGGLGHLAIQFSNKFGFKTLAVSSGSKKKDLAIKLGAHEYIDASAENAVEKIQKMGGAKVIIVTASGGDIEGMVRALGVDGTMIVVSVLTEPLKVDTLHLIGTRGQVIGWPCGSACVSF
jgi:alcohol dehydrogenase, propanol-preferring